MKQTKEIIKRLSKKEVRAVACKLVELTRKIASCRNCEFGGCDLSPEACELKILKAAIVNAEISYNMDEF